MIHLQFAVSKTNLYFLSVVSIRLRYNAVLDSGSSCDGFGGIGAKMSVMMPISADPDPIYKAKK